MFAKQLNYLKNVSIQRMTNLDAYKSQVDTEQGGIWGRYDVSPAQPSQLAIDLKTIVKTNGVTLVVYRWGCQIPAETGDGTGFPAGFGDWWRSE